MLIFLTTDRFGFQEQRQSPTFQPQSPTTTPPRKPTTTPPRKPTTKPGQNRTRKPPQLNREQYGNGSNSHENTSNSYGKISNSRGNNSNSYGNNSNSYGNNSNSYGNDSNSYENDSNSYENDSNSYGNARPGSNGSNRSGSNEARKNSGSQIRNRKKQVSKKASGPSKVNGGFGGSNVDQFAAPGGLGTSGLNDPEAFQSGSNGNLVPCFKCGRTFAADRVEKHHTICNNTKQRKVFNSTKSRTEGTEAAAYNRPGRASSNKPQMPKSKSNWRKKHGKAKHFNTWVSGFCTLLAFGYS